MTVRLLGFMKRLPDISFEDFDRHWTNHGALVASLPAIKSGLVKYKQFHTAPQMAVTLESAGFSVAQYDGVAEFEAGTLEDILDIFQSDEYETKLLPDEAKFFRRAVVQVMAGRDQSEFGTSSTVG